MKWFNLVFVCFVLGGVLEAQSSDLDTEGTDFWFTFMPNAHNTDHPSNSSDSLHIYVTSKTPTKGKIFYNEVRSTGITPKEIDFEITQPNEVYHFSIHYFYVALRGEYYNGGANTTGFANHNPTFENETVSVKSIHITTEEKSVVYTLDYAVTSSDAFIVFPTHSLGKEYFIMSYVSSYYLASHPSQFAIVGVKNNTTIKIIPTAPTRRNGLDTQTITLNQGEVYLVQCSITAAFEDLTGSHIVADKEIAVFAGHQRTAIPPNGVSRDCLLSQMLPVSTLGKNAIITPFAESINNSYSDIFRVLAIRDDTEIYVDDSLVATLDKGKYYQADFKKASIISSNNPIMVATFMKTSSTTSSTNTTGDPSMIIIPPVEQYKNSYTVVNAQRSTRDYYGVERPIFTEQYLTIIATIEAIEAGIYLNGDLLDSAIFTPIGATDYHYVNYVSTDGTHNINSIYPISVIAYGYGQAVSYGYLGGMGMQDLKSINLAEITNLHLAPNPTNETTTLTLDLQTAGNLKITLNDLLGNEIFELHNAFEDTGTFTKTFSIEDLPLGVYFLRISHNGNVRMEKVIKN